MKAISDNLIHFLDRKHKDSPNLQLTVFKSIIENGLNCGKVQINYAGSGFVSGDAICFTDIPLSFCDENTSIYGKFGIGFKKSFVKIRGGNPVRYIINYVPGENIESRGMLYLNLSKHHNKIKILKDRVKNSDFSLFDDKGEEVINNSDLSIWIDEQIAILTFDKESGDLGPARDDSQGTDPYYNEREWRLIPFGANVSLGFCEEKFPHSFKFSRDDINIVVTPNENIRLEVLEYFDQLKKHQDSRLNSFGKFPVTVVNYDDLHRW